MATILLQPGEQFEHQHDASSTTTLREGEARLTIGRETIALRRGITVDVPPRTPHVMENTGDVVAVIDCGHGGSPASVDVS